ncbi:MAG: prepilin-type N-terminal cleavage/methylation domain-containing protein [Pseudomonadales bacterium]|nr:prepilin-type N-terminal cleavage/methylation domain-containing protein [Pseudomonadales bacterium]
MPRQSTGFTLVEVVVALSILSLVMLVTVTGLRTLANTQTALERMTDRIDEVRTVSAFVRDTMESAVVGGGPGELSLGGSGSEKKGYFALFPDALAWRSTILIGESFGGSYLLRVAREDDLLVLRWQQADARGEPGDWAAADARTLVRDLEEFEVSWRDSYNGEWRQDWVPGDEALWVKLQIRASDRYWPELIMQVPQ